MRTVYYDIETDSKYAPYANIKLCGLLWDNGEEVIYKFPLEPDEIKELRSILADPTIKKVGFNNCNYDDLVLYRHGFPVCETNRHDGFLAAKTLWPELPAFGLKFLNWYLFGDFHWPEYELEKATVGMTTEARFATGPDHLLETYNSHDLQQHKNLWLHIEPLLVDRAKAAYELDLSQGKVIEQMIFRGGLYLDRSKCEKMVCVLERAKSNALALANKISKGAVTKNSGKQLGKYFDEIGIEMDLTESGEFKVDKDLIRQIWRNVPVAKCIKNLRKADSMLKYYKNYLRALDDTTFDHIKDWIPVSFSISGARSRRYTSSSKYGLNFQNPSDDAKRVHRVPEGWLGFWIDATQIENIVHIYESGDLHRRHAYEADPNWSEYVWLCNMILGTNLSKKQLEKIVSEQNELWSVYKQYKTVKLMMNFGAGIKKFCEVTGFSLKDGKELFAKVHRACPAIKRLQNRVKNDFERYGEVYDSFGHVYRTSEDYAHKLVAYLIQGCGTGSLPKAQLRANYDTLQAYNNLFGNEIAVLSGTTHDETGGRIHLSIGGDNIERILEELMYNMTKRFENKFDGIPLRAKLYLSTTTAHDRIECKSYADFLEHSK